MNDAIFFSLCVFYAQSLRLVCLLQKESSSQPTNDASLGLKFALGGRTRELSETG